MFWNILQTQHFTVPRQLLRYKTDQFPGMQEVKIH
jgi:hypothetical protein